MEAPRRASGFAAAVAVGVKSVQTPTGSQRSVDRRRSVRGLYR